VWSKATANERDARSEGPTVGTSPGRGRSKPSGVGAVARGRRWRGGRWGGAAAPWSGKGAEAAVAPPCANWEGRLYRQRPAAGQTAAPATRVGKAVNARGRQRGRSPQQPTDSIPPYLSKPQVVQDFK
jgi:hypothetical protein